MAQQPASGRPKLPAIYGAPSSGSQNSEMETVRIPQNGGAVIITRPKQKPAENPLAGAAEVPSTPISYQSSINVGGGIGKQGILNGLLDTGSQPNPDVSAFARGTAWNDAAQIGRGIDAQNQQLQMTQQSKRSESALSGLGNLAKIYGDMSERSVSQQGLAAQIAANNIGFAAGMYRRVE
jgi:hypothetical protein